MRKTTILICMLFSKIVFAIDPLDIELGKEFPNASKYFSSKLHPASPTELKKFHTSGALNKIFTSFEVWVLNEKQRRVAIIHASRKFQSNKECGKSEEKLKNILVRKYGESNFQYSNNLSGKVKLGTEYIFYCKFNEVTKSINLSLWVRNGEMGIEIEKH